MKFAALLALLVSHSAFADRIYQVEPGFASVQALGDVVDSIPQLGIVVLRSPASAKTGLRDLGDVGQVHLIAPMAVPSVPSGLWGLKAIHLADAWKVSQGAGVVVAVSDTGVSSNHSLLKTQMWKNKGETGVDSKGASKESNAIDDDGDGYIDDVYGWDFVKNKPGGTDHHYHGTHVAGTIAAAASKRMVGIAPSARVMDVSFLDEDGSGSDLNGAKTIVYAVDHGAKVINCSWGGAEGGAAVLESAIKYANAHGVLVIAAAGNDSSDNDKHTFTPANYAEENIIAIGATSSASGWVASFSNYGQTTVDLAAPGDQIYSLAPNNSYQTLSGTSMATPHVVGAAALVWSAHPKWTAAHVKAALMTVSPVKAWKKKSVSGGQLRADLAVSAK